MQAIAGETEGDEFSLRCVGGLRADGTFRDFKGTPVLGRGDDVIAFFDEDASFCQVRGWEQGAFQVVRSPSGEEVVVNSRGRSIASVDDSGLTLGRMPTWLPQVSPRAARAIEHAAHLVGARQVTTNEAKAASASEVAAGIRRFAAARGKTFHRVAARRPDTGQLPELKPFNAAGARGGQP